MRDSDWRTELEELLCAAELGELSAAQSARLNELLRDSDDALDTFAEAMEVDALLRWHSGVAKPTAPAVRRKNPLRLVGLAAAAAALFLITYVNWDAGQPLSVPAPQSSATDYEVAQVGAWELESHPDAQFEVVSPNSVRLTSGELLVRSMAEEPGALEIETPDGLVRAQGTEFYVGAHKTTGGMLPMKRLTRVLVLSGTVALTNSLGEATATRGEFLVAEDGFAPIAVVANANNSFGLDLYSELAKDTDENLFFSPYSISLALAMTMEGARGETAAELGRALHIPTLMRRVGEDDQRLPFALTDFHTGHGELTRMLTEAKSSPEQAAMRKRRDKLSRQLASLDERIEELSAGENYRDANVLRREARTLRDEKDELDQAIDSYVVAVTNALFGEQTYPFNADYLATIDGAYGTGSIRNVDFIQHPERERRLINDWVEDRTEGLIEELIAPDMITDETRLALVNAIYFHGNWVEPFKPRWTRERAFTLRDGSSVEVRMMHQTMSSARYGAFETDGSRFETPVEVTRGQTEGLYPSDGGFELLEVPYQGGDLSMVILLPRTPAGLSSLESKLTSRNLARWVEELDRREADVYIPVFDADSSFELKEILKLLGVKRAFTNPAEERGAQFSGMTDATSLEEQLYISAVVHKASLHVDEKGTEAAAATAVMTLRAGSAHPDTAPFKPTFKADRPFVYAIRDKNTGTLLFLGRCVNPE